MIFKNEYKKIESELQKLLSMNKSRPYIFRIRLERLLERLLNYSIKNNLAVMQKNCQEIKDKLQYISDQSNQTSDGTLKSFVFLENDLINLLTRLRVTVN